MKILLCFSFFVLLVSSACNKDNGNSTNQSVPYLKYKINGQQVDATGDLPFNFTPNDKGVLCYRQLKQSGFQNTFYQIMAGANSKERISLYIPLDTINVMNYYMDSIAFMTTIGNLSLAHNDSTYRFYRNWDYVKINITSYNNGTISGTFDCNLTHYSSSSNTYTPLKVSDGIFYNVKIYQ